MLQSVILEMIKVFLASQREGTIQAMLWGPSNSVLGFSNTVDKINIKDDHLVVSGA